MTAISPLETAAVRYAFHKWGGYCWSHYSTVAPHAQHRGYGFLEFADDTSASNAIQHMNGFELAGQKLKVGKASPSAMLINLTLSQDKVVSPKSGESAVLPTVEKDPAVADDAADERRCLCLLNMVDKGDVDDELADEVRDECSRFGAVERVAVQELEDHVRVFVVFLASDGAQQAKRAMHGRFFGGKQVRAGFYPLEQLRVKRYESGFLP
jgi:RNA recognition motif-containing protein